MWANLAFRPQVGLDVGESGVLVVEMGGGQYGVGHRESPMASILYLAYGVVKCNVAKLKQITSVSEATYGNNRIGRFTGPAC